MNHRMLFLPVAGVLCALLAGCATRVLPTGRYVGGKDGEIYAEVYKDMIFLNVKTPQNAAGEFADWVWAGKYSIDDYDNLRLEAGEIPFVIPEHVAVPAEAEFLVVGRNKLNRVYVSVIRPA